MSDAILYPTRGQLANVGNISEQLIYVPKADKNTYGIVKLGEGFYIDENGATNFDLSSIKIEKIQKNGVDITPVNKIVNITISKEDVGLSNVNDTSDADKPISNLTLAKFSELERALSLDISTVNSNLTSHVSNKANPHGVTKSQLGLGNVDNTADINKPISQQTRTVLDSLNSKIDTKTNDINTSFMSHKNDTDNPHSVTKAQLGLNNVDNTSDINKPVSLATQRVLDKLSTDFVTLSSNVTRLEGLISQGASAVSFSSYAAAINDFNMAATNKYSVGQTVLINKTKVPDLWVYSVENTHIDYVYKSDADILNALDSVGYVQFGYYRLAELETRKIDLDNYVTLNSYQNITGTKVFTEQIGILNGAEGEINYIKHINNNFLISSSDGENIVNIDEQLRKFNFYNKPLALEEYVDDNFISYTTQQELTDEQKEIARANIGAGTGGGAVDIDYATNEKAGIIRIATNEEAAAGTYDAVAITPRQLTNAIETSLGSVEAWLIDLNTGVGI